MKLRALCAATVLLSLFFPPGCDLLPDDGSGTVNLGECVDGPLSISVPVDVFCSVSRIDATIAGPDMNPIDVSIDKENPSATLTIPSGPDRELVVEVYTVDDPDSPFLTSKTYVFCVGDLEPVTVAVDVTLKNKDPEIGAISPSGGELTPGEPVSLSVTARDPDACDGVKSFSWSTDFGSIAESGDKAARASSSSSTATWTPACPDKNSCEATVKVTASDGRGGTDTAQATYQIAAVRQAAAPAAPGNNAPTVSLSGSDLGISFDAFTYTYCYQWSLTVTAADPEGDAMSFGWDISSSPEHGILGTWTSSSTTVTWSYCESTTPFAFAYEDTVKVTVTDSHGSSATATFDVRNWVP